MPILGSASAASVSFLLATFVSPANAELVGRRDPRDVQGRGGPRPGPPTRGSLAVLITRIAPASGVSLAFLALLIAAATSSRCREANGSGRTWTRAAPGRRRSPSPPRARRSRAGRAVQRATDQDPRRPPLSASDEPRTDPHRRDRAGSTIRARASRAIALRTSSASDPGSALLARHLDLDPDLVQFRPGIRALPFSSSRPRSWAPRTSSMAGAPARAGRRARPGRPGARRGRSRGRATPGPSSSGGRDGTNDPESQPPQTSPRPSISQRLEHATRRHRPPRRPAGSGTPQSWKPPIVVSIRMIDE